MELYFYHPLAGKKDLIKMTETFSSTRSTLVDHTVRLKAAMRIILVESARQIVESYKRILTEHSDRISRGEDSSIVAVESVRRILDVTETVADMAVMYLKNATRDVVDTTVNDVKIVLGRLTDTNDIEPIAKICRFDSNDDICYKDS